MAKRFTTKLAPSSWYLLAVWVLATGGYAVVSLVVPPGPARTVFGDIAQDIFPLYATVGLLLNARSANWRQNAFWMLQALGCAMWMGANSLWTYYEVVLHQLAPQPFAGDVVFFVSIVPMIGALALEPHVRRRDLNVGLSCVDFALLLLWWVYLYFFSITPWQYILPDKPLYSLRYNELYVLEIVILLAGLGWLAVRAKGPWRLVYAQLFGAIALFRFGDQLIDIAILQDKYSTGSLYDIPLVAGLVWLGNAGISIHRRAIPNEPVAKANDPEITWSARLATLAVLSMPALAVWAVWYNNDPPAVRQFRLLVTLIASVVMTSLVLLRQHMVNQERLRLLHASQESLKNLERLQAQLVQQEKLTSLGQLVAGAAHEINNPLTAILGYSEVALETGIDGEKLRAVVKKIRAQAVRTKTLVTDLLNFSRQVPPHEAFLDVNHVVNGAVQLSNMILRNHKISIEVESAPGLASIRGDSDQLMRVFLNIISNAVDAMEEVGGGVLRIRLLQESSTVVVELSDTGPGMKEPRRVFDPFYTTKPVGKGTGLGLSICYGILQEHGGSISCHNRPEGGATFRVQLPAVEINQPQPSPAHSLVSKSS